MKKLSFLLLLLGSVSAFSQGGTAENSKNTEVKTYRVGEVFHSQTLGFFLFSNTEEKAMEILVENCIADGNEIDRCENDLNFEVEDYKLSNDCGAPICNGASISMRAELR